MSRPPAALLDPSAYEFSIDVMTRFSDVDPNGHINNVAMASIFEDARIRYDIFLGRQGLMGEVRPMIVSVNIDYLRQAYFPAPMTLKCGLMAIGTRSWSIAQLALQRDKPRAICRSTLVATDGKNSVPLPEALRARLEKAARLEI